MRTRVRFPPPPPVSHPLFLDSLRFGGQAMAFARYVIMGEGRQGCSLLIDRGMGSPWGGWAPATPSCKAARIYKVSRLPHAPSIHIRFASTRIASSSCSNTSTAPSSVGILVERIFSVPGFSIVHPARRRRPMPTGLEPLQQFRQVRLPLGLVLRRRHPIHTRRRIPCVPTGTPRPSTSDATLDTQASASDRQPDLMTRFGHVKKRDFYCALPGSVG